ncbi:MAG: glycosyltransferase [Nitrospiraceae bacterium]|nr:MAG: glycosyltransferase [Nitrospiraceae bacterium]
MPTFNEAGHIEDLIHATVNAIRHTGIQKIEVIVVDDNSPDKTWEIASNTTCEAADIRVIRRMKDHGLTASLKEGISSASHDIIIWFDCDFTHPPECIPQLLFMISQGFEVVVNSRYIIGGGEDRRGKGSFIQLILSKSLNWGIRFFLYPTFSDYTSGFIAVQREVLKAIPLRGDYGEYFIDFIFRVLSKKYRVCELPYMAMPRRSGESKTGSNILHYLKRGKKYIYTVIRLRFEKLFGLL